MFRTCTLALTAALAMADAGHASDGGSTPRLKERLPEEQRRDQSLKDDTRSDGAIPDSLDASGKVMVRATAIQVDGAIAISADVFEPILSNYLNRDLTQGDLAKLAADLTGIYRAQGYFLSRAVIPPQTLQHGRLVVRIEEGRISGVDLEGTPTPDVIGYFTYLLAEVPARRGTLDRVLLTVGDLPGVVVQSSRTVPVEHARGEYRLVLALGHEDVDGQIRLDNRGSEGAGLQLSSTIGVNGVGTTGSRLSVDFYVDPENPDKDRYGQIEASAPLGLRGTYVSVFASASVSVDGKFGADRYQTRGAETGIELTQQLYRNKTLSASAGVQIAQANTEVTLNGVGRRKDELALARLNVRLDARDSWHGRNRFDAEMTLGRDSFQTATPLHPMARNDDNASFTKFTLNASRNQRIDEAWSVFAAIRAQYSEDPLPEDEEISFGGARWGRAYDYGEIEGDSGIAGQVELRYATQINGFVQSVTGYAFADAASVWDLDFRGEPDGLASAGLGLRADLDRGLRAALEAAYPLNRTPDGEDGRNPRLFATVSQEF
jgi:hemolysin activation/secretion protein